MFKTIPTIVLATLCLNFKVKSQDLAHKPPQLKTVVVGKVISISDQVPLGGAVINVDATNQTVITNNEGEFILNLPNGKYNLSVYYISYRIKNIPIVVPLKEKLLIGLEIKENPLNEIQVVGYGQTTKRLNTGSVSTLTSKQIEQQPVTNVLSALSGRMPGVFVQTTNGLPGGNVSIQIRGKGSLTAGTNPLYIIDGVPFDGEAIGAGKIITTQSVTGPMSPLNMLNPSDIENISILKDADATSIYGSRGSNGVILITTKKGKAGKTQTSVNFNYGMNRAANLPKLLDLSQYLQIRKEAFKNDGVTPSADPNSFYYAPDLLVWDQNKSTDWAKYLLGGTGHVTNLQASISGGTERTTFSVGGNFHRETNILPGNSLYQRGGIHFSLQHASTDDKFKVTMSNTFGLDHNELSNLSNNVNSDLLLPPNYPLYDTNGQINQTMGNPLGQIKARSKTDMNNMVSNVVLQYKLTPEFEAKLNTGYNRTENQQVNTFPAISLSPGEVNFTNFGQNTAQSFILEPQLNYNLLFSQSKFNFLLGSTYQSRNTNEQYITAQNFSMDALMGNLGSAGSIFARTNGYTQYRYLSFFGRITYVLQDKYFLNATVRRDGSSRFGPGHQFGNFGSIATSWLFGNEEWVKNNLSFLSFGKIRSSYGTTGNDQIQDYQYLATYGNSKSIYEGLPGLEPQRIANTNFKWETTRKLEFALELGFLEDKILFNINRYQNQSKDQLIQYTLPRLTGFSSYQANLPAVVQNTGWEFELQVQNTKIGHFNWTAAFNLTLLKNKLKSFESFETSAYGKTYQLGYDITRISGAFFQGIDPATGLAKYQIDPNDPDQQPYLYHTIGKQTPDLYGGLSNALTYKNWSLNLFLSFAKQMGKGNLSYTPGLAQNNYAAVLNRWRNPGDVTNVPKSSLNTDYYYGASSGNYFNTSYVRFKTVDLSYQIPSQWISNDNSARARIYAQAQNLFTIWKRNAAVADPESGADGIPPLKSFVLGFQLDF